MPAVAFKTGGDVDAAHELRFHAEDDDDHPFCQQRVEVGDQRRFC